MKRSLPQILCVALLIGLLAPFVMFARAATISIVQQVTYSGPGGAIPIGGSNNQTPTSTNWVRYVLSIGNSNTVVNLAAGGIVPGYVSIVEGPLETNVTGMILVSSDGTNSLIQIGTNDVVGFPVHGSQIILSNTAVTPMTVGLSVLPKSNWP